MNNQIPKFLKIEDGRTVATRPRLHVDEVAGTGTALDVVRVRPMLKTKIIKKTKRRLAELEELKTFVDKKGYLNISKTELEAILKD